MPFAFLVPAFLAGLAALAVPLLLHLRQRDKEKPLRFPSLMFLRRIAIETSHRRRVTDLPLLLLRALAVALAVLAFSRPVFQRAGKALGAPPERVVILAVDRSMSMGHTAVWPVAMDSARAIIRALKAGDRIAVIAFDDDASVIQPMTTDHAAALAALGTVRPGARGTRFAAALRAARQQMAAANLPRAEVLVVSDLQ
ncbi:MAG: VWA domain-containing protein, partial [Gemmatimonadales bacterium]|nr:VWA domain-containing protein [Gemmatimonadales bacterium]